MRGTLARHLEPFIKQVNIAIADAKEQGIIPTPELARERLNGLAGFVTDVPEISFTEQRAIESPDGVIKTRVYSPNTDVALPVMIFFHGGGHMCGSADLYDPMCRKMALASDAVVINVDYRLAPEHRYPAAIVDAEYVVRHYRDLLKGIPHNDTLIIAGDSAGGAMCSTLAMHQTADPSLGIDKQILIYPSVDYTMTQPSLDENGTGFFLEKPRIEWYFEHYFSGNDDPKKASPLYGPVNEHTPATLVLLASCDPLRDEGLAYGEKLAAADVSVTTHVFDGMIHAFMNIEDLVPEECAQLYHFMGEFIND
ncbi:MAG: alpha/beta hydrolase [Enterobacterales bacterium]|nr:alpha/beta hydrolase [Enterobacterales bacterium]